MNSFFNTNDCSDLQRLEKHQWGGGESAFCQFVLLYGVNEGWKVSESSSVLGKWRAGVGTLLQQQMLCVTA